MYICVDIYVCIAHFLYVCLCTCVISYLYMYKYIYVYIIHIHKYVTYNCIYSKRSLKNILNFMLMYVSENEELGMLRRCIIFVFISVFFNEKNIVSLFSETLF